MSEEERPALPVPADLGAVVEAIPGVARIAAASWWNTTRWSVRAGWRMTRRVFAAATDPDVAAELAHEMGVTIVVITELARQVNAGVPLPKALMELGRVEPAAVVVEPEGERLRRRGAALLDRSRDVRSQDGVHPAYDRILDELAPDEARILVFLHASGPQPSLDVRTGGPTGMVSSRLVAGGLNMLGARAGLRYVDEVPAYLNNLHRLGLTLDSREPLENPADYQVLEAQPDVLEALHSVRMAKTIRRSIRLTPFGTEFCDAVLTKQPDA